MPDRYGEYELPTHPPAPGPVPPWPLTPEQEVKVIAEMTGAPGSKNTPTHGVQVIPEQVPEGIVPPSTSTRTPPSRWQVCPDCLDIHQGTACPDAPPEPTGDLMGLCGVSTPGLVAGRHLGPCILRSGHDGPMHQDGEGVQWAGSPGLLPEPTGDLRERLADALRAAAHQCDDHCDCRTGDHRVFVTALEDGTITEVEGTPEVIADAVLPVVEAETAAYRDLLADIWLYVDCRYVTRQLTTEQKELWADAVEVASDPEAQVTVDRWWRE